jgi:hypothetical protein
MVRGYLFAINGKNLVSQNDQYHLFYLAGWNEVSKVLQDLYVLDNLNSSSWKVRTGALAGAVKVKVSVILYT